MALKTLRWYFAPTISHSSSLSLTHSNISGNRDEHIFFQYHIRERREVWSFFDQADYRCQFIVECLHALKSKESSIYLNAFTRFLIIIYYFCNINIRCTIDLTVRVSSMTKLFLRQLLSEALWVLSSDLFDDKGVTMKSVNWNQNNLIWNGHFPTGLIGIFPLI